MRYLVRIGKLKEKINYLDEQLSTIYDKINELEKIKSEINWNGDAATTFIELYDNYLEELKEIEKSTLTYIKFLLSYCDKYGTEYELLRKKYSSLLDEVVKDE